MSQETKETITFRTSSDFTPRRFRERQPADVVKAIMYDGTFPLQFLEDNEYVRAKGDGDGTALVGETDRKGKDWDMADLPVGHWLVRWPTLGLRVHDPGNFEAGFEEVTPDAT